MIKWGRQLIGVFSFCIQHTVAVMFSALIAGKRVAGGLRQPSCLFWQK